MIVCPECKTENPSKAQFCLKCGAELGNGELPEDVRLQKDLALAKETIGILQKSLSESQDELAAAIAEKEALQIENDTQKSHIDDLSAELFASKSVISQLKIDKEKRAKGGKKGKWGWAFVVLSVIFFFVAVAWNKKVKDLESQLSSEKSNIADSTVVYQQDTVEIREIPAAKKHAVKKKNVGASATKAPDSTSFRIPCTEANTTEAQTIEAIPPTAPSAEVQALENSSAGAQSVPATQSKPKRSKLRHTNQKKSSISGEM